jgi:hypothetical protein
VVPSARRCSPAACCRPSGAQKAVQTGEVGARFALRQSLIDLAAIAELAADELPAPTLEALPLGLEHRWLDGTG